MDIPCERERSRQPEISQIAQIQLDGFSSVESASSAKSADHRRRLFGDIFPVRILLTTLRA
jgi:hypothetical protein